MPKKICKYCAREVGALDMTLLNYCNKSPSGKHVITIVYQSDMYCQYCGKKLDKLDLSLLNSCSKSPSGKHVLA